MKTLPTRPQSGKEISRDFFPQLWEVVAELQRGQLRGDGKTVRVQGGTVSVIGDRPPHHERHDVAIAKVTDAGGIDATEQTWNGSAWEDGDREWDSDTALGVLADPLGQEPALNDLVVVARGAGGKWVITGGVGATLFGMADVGGKSVTSGTVASSEITFPDGSTTTSTIALQGLASGQSFTFPSGIDIYVFSWDGGYGGLWPYSMTDFDGSADTTQVYGHVDGEFKWFNTCPPDT